MHESIHHRRALTFGAALLLCAAIIGRTLAGEPSTYSSIVVPQTASAEPANWQLPIDGQSIDSQSIETLPPGMVPTDTTDPRPSPVGQMPPGRGAAPLLDDGNNEHDVVIGQELNEYDEQGRRSVRPYGGGHPWDWPWGCGGSPFRTGPGNCDTWRVGCRWDVAVDGMTMRREGTNLSAIWNETDDGQGIPELFEQFDYAPGGRVSLIGRYPPCAGYRVHAGFEGVEKWEALIVYPKFFPDEDGNPELTEQRRVHYTSNLYSGELNVLKCYDTQWQPYCGVRYMKFDDELRIFDDQEAPGPLAVMMPPPLEVLTTDMTNLFDLENNLMGFQIGLRHDFWQVSKRFGIEGFVNGGVYYNKVKYTNLMNVTTTQRIGDDLSTTDEFEGQTTVVSATNLDSSDLSEIAYSWEASLSGVFRINKCWQMRAGYQVLWINGLRLADDAFLDPDNFTGNGTRDLLFQGWHAGIECRR